MRLCVESLAWPVGATCAIRPPLAANSNRAVTKLAATRTIPTMSAAPTTTGAAAAASRIRIAFVGAGNMATAIIRGLLAKNVVPAACIRASSPSGPSKDLADLGIITCRSNADCVSDAEVVVLAVKPFALPAAIASCRDALNPAATIISIAAGTSLAQLQHVRGARRCGWPRARGGGLLTGHCRFRVAIDIAPSVSGCHRRLQALGADRPTRIVRVMPNTPCSIGEGISAYCLGAHATADDAALVRRILSAAGEVVEVKESQMDGACAIGRATCMPPAATVTCGRVWLVWRLSLHARPAPRLNRRTAPAVATPPPPPPLPPHALQPSRACLGRVPPTCSCSWRHWLTAAWRRACRGQPPWPWRCRRCVRGAALLSALPALSAFIDRLVQRRQWPLFHPSHALFARLSVSRVVCCR